VPLQRAAHIYEQGLIIFDRILDQNLKLRTLILCLLICLGNIAYSQTNLDSLYATWENQSESDSIRSMAYGDYIWFGFLFSNPDSAFLLAQDLLRFGEIKKFNSAKSRAYQIMGVFSALKSDYPKALGFLEQSLTLSEEMGEKRQMSKVISNIGNIYRMLGNESKALENYQMSLKIFTEIGDLRGSANSITSIGVIYADRGDYLKSLEYFQRSLRIHEDEGDKVNTANSTANIGENYYLLGDDVKALEYLLRSLKIYQEIGNTNGSSSTMANIGIIHSDQGNYNQALDYLKSSSKIQKEIGDKVGYAGNLISIGMIYQAQRDFKKALEHCNIALAITEESRALGEQKNACNCLYETYKAMGRGNEALIYIEKIQVIDDSLNAEETTKQLQQMEFAKQVYADSVEKAEEARLVQEAHEKEVAQKNKTRNMLIGGGLLALLLAGGLFSRVRFVRKAKNRIEEEKDRSENLLLNILPADIASELKEHGKAEARDFEMVSILFTDFKSFTQVSEKMSARDLVSNINHCFEAFDTIMGKYGVEKIKTIGDAYMAAGGLPVETKDSIKNTVLAALEMQRFIFKLREEKEAKGEHAFEMRVGIHTGPVVAGIVGVKKFQYDIWGDTVNTASRMESHGEVGEVNISQATYELIKDDSQFSFEHRGKISAKGKGEVDMYFVSLK
jgi:adenylate cyclase